MKANKIPPRKSRLSSLIAAVFGISLLFSLAGCYNPWMAAILKPGEETDTPETITITITYDVTNEETEHGKK
jgi:hypothetical protein